MSELKKTLKRIKKIAKKLAKEEREVLLGGLQEYLRQTERLLSGSKHSKKVPSKKSVARKSRVGTKKGTEAVASPADGPTMVEPGDGPSTVN